MRNTKKGFTIVELVIVIAVIAILAAVLIPTFNSVIEKANESAATSKAKNALTIVTAEKAQELGKNVYYFKATEGSTDFWFSYDASGSATLEKITTGEPSGTTALTLTGTAANDLAATGVSVFYKAKTTTNPTT